jgi:hypothetical protein
MLHNEITRSVCQLFGEYRVLGYISDETRGAALAALQGYLGVKGRKVAALLEQQVRGWVGGCVCGGAGGGHAAWPTGIAQSLHALHVRALCAREVMC